MEFWTQNLTKILEKYLMARFFTCPNNRKILMV